MAAKRVARRGRPSSRAGEVLASASRPWTFIAGEFYFGKYVLKLLLPAEKQVFYTKKVVYGSANGLPEKYSPAILCACACVIHVLILLTMNRFIGCLCRPITGTTEMLLIQCSFFPSILFSSPKITFQLYFANKAATKKNCESPNWGYLTPPDNSIGHIRTHCETAWVWFQIKFACVSVTVEWCALAARRRTEMHSLATLLAKMFSPLVSEK